MDASITPRQFQDDCRSDHSPIVIDVRREPAFLAAPDILSGALRRDPAIIERWAGELPSAARVVVYCVHGHEVSQNAARVLREHGVQGQFIEGGLEACRAAGSDFMCKPAGAATRWVTRERPKVDRIACPWLIQRFVDSNAQFLYVPTAEVQAVAAQKQAIPYDIAGVAFTHDGELCTFDALLKTYRITDPALKQLAHIVRGADTARPELAPQAPGLVALSSGLSELFVDDHEMLSHGMVMYDALYLWCRAGRDKAQLWQLATYH
jgi:rhodanese-related sulfurtransferase